MTLIEVFVMFLQVFRQIKNSAWVGTGTDLSFSRRDRNRSATEALWEKVMFDR